VSTDFEVIQEHSTQLEKRFIMPSQRTANKSNKSYVKDSGGRTDNAGAEGCNSASIVTKVSKSTRKSTRTRGEAANRSASVDTVSATAPDTQVSLADSPETVVIPRDRENQACPTNGPGNYDVTQHGQQAGSNVRNFQNQGSGTSRVFVDGRWGILYSNRPVFKWPSYSASHSISAHLPASLIRNPADYVTALQLHGVTGVNGYCSAVTLQRPIQGTRVLREVRRLSRVGPVFFNF